MITDTDSTAVASGAATMGIIALVVGIVAYVLFSFLLSKIFAKAGVESWKAWVPVYSNWTFLELGEQKGWFALLFFIPIINIVPSIYTIIAAHKIGLAFGKGVGYTVLYVLLQPIWLALLAFSNVSFNGSNTNDYSASDNEPEYNPNANFNQQTVQQVYNDYSQPTQPQQFAQPAQFEQPQQPVAPQAPRYQAPVLPDRLGGVQRPPHFGGQPKAPAVPADNSNNGEYTPPVVTPRFPKLPPLHTPNQAPEKPNVDPFA